MTAALGTLILVATMIIHPSALVRFFPQLLTKRCSTFVNFRCLPVEPKMTEAEDDSGINVRCATDRIRKLSDYL
jgi:hypothetical protein